MSISSQKTKRKELLFHLASARINKLPLSEAHPLIIAHGTSPCSARISCDTHAFCEIGVVTRGKYCFLDRRTKSILTPGNFWCYGPWEPHGWIVPKEGAHRILILFLPSFLLKIMPEDSPLPYLPFIISGLKTKIQPTTPSQRKANIRLAKELLSEYFTRQSGWQSIIQLKLAIFFMKLLQKAVISSFEQNPKLKIQALKITNAVQYIRQFINEKLTVKKIASHANISRRELALSFKELTGASIPEYIIKCRLDGVKHALLTSNEKLECIAQYWGFTNASHLCNSFKRHCKITPNDFRYNPSA